MNLSESRTLTVSVARDADTVYQFVSNPENLPRWATAFCQSVRKVDSDWVMQTPAGEMKVRFVPANAFRVADHFVSPTPGAEIYVPLRVLPNGAGSEMVFTLFRQANMLAADFARDIELVRSDLQSLKRGLEA